MKIRPIAIYLPQFHPIPENDEWWGKGFTEWTNVTKAKPLFKGHYQPHLPADLGFYDLRLAEVRQQQAELAKEYGIYGFCYYHYWFNGRRILEKPFNEVFESGKPDFPFMLCWANENWTRTWDNNVNNKLLVQEYSLEDDLKHIQSLIPYFKDNRYIKVDGKPVFAVYRSNLIPDAKKTLKVWREEAAKHNLELYIVRFENFGNHGNEFLENAGFDAAIDFQPFNYQLDLIKKRNEKKFTSIKEIIKNFFYLYIINRFSKSKYIKFHNERWAIFDYTDYVNFVTELERPNYKQYPGITPMWDNVARKSNNFFIFKNATPTAYKFWLKSIKQKFIPYSKDENFIFINAWNEWAEGNHLEPCLKWGKAYLEATKDALTND